MDECNMNTNWPSFSHNLWQQEINEILPNLICTYSQFVENICMIRRDCSIFTKPPCDNKTSLPVKNEFSHTWGDLVYVLNHAGHTIDIKYGLNTRAMRMLSGGKWTEKSAPISH